MNIKKTPLPKRRFNKSDDFQLTLPVLNQKTKMAELDFLGSISKR
jgi:hypothetical protein